MSDSTTPPAPPDTSAGDGSAYRRGPPPDDGGNYLVIWDNGNESVLRGRSLNLKCAIAHIPIPALPSLRYDSPKRGEWGGRFTWPNKE